MYFFHKNGRVAARGWLRQGLQDEDWTYFKEDGTLLMTVHFCDGRPTDRNVAPPAVDRMSPLDIAPQTGELPSR